MLSRVRARSLALVRRHGREIAWTPEWMRLGNLLNLSLWAYQGGQQGRRRAVLQTPALESWFPLLEGLGDYSVARDQVRFTDRRVMPWRNDDGQRWFSFEELSDFIRTARLGESVLRHAAARGVAAAPDQLTVNVRRGDYYLDPANRAEFGFDVDGYLRHVLPQALERDGPVRRVRVVSDGLDWCRQHLAWLDERVEEVSFADGGSPERDLLEVASSARLVITNSTFSYWGAYISNVAHGAHAQTWAPRFFWRSGRPTTSLDPRWTIVEELPGGWDLPAEAASES